MKNIYHKPSRTRRCTMKKSFAIPVAAMLICALSFSIIVPAQAYLWPDRNLTIGMTGDDVLSLQAALTDQGYDPGVLDGVFGSYTESALLTYQSMNGLYVDGIAGPATLSVLYGDAPAEAPQEADSGQIGRTLYRGMTGSDVSALQSMLAVLGYYNAVIDGDFGGMTESAVIDFQTAMGLYVDGIAGPYTIEALNSGSSPAAPSQTGTSPAAFGRNLARGMTGSDVTALQTLLQKLGYYKADIDGDFGGVTQSAVIAFQTANGLYADGVAGPYTFEALQAMEGTGSPANTADTPAEPAASIDSPAAVSGSAPVLYAISNAPGGIEVNWEPVTGAASYRVFRLDASGTWQPVGDTSEVYFIDQNVVSGSRYTYTVRALTADGSYAGDYDKTGISFTHTYNYDSYVASAPDFITKSMIEEQARRIGLDANEAKGLIAWVEGEGYVYIGEPYVAYLSACVVINGLLDSVYSRGEGFLQQMSTWGSYFALENLKKRFENPSQQTLLAVYLAMTHLQTGIYYCRGALSKPQNCFYDAGFVVQGEDIYVW